MRFTYRCECKTCGYIAFTAPEGYIDGTAKEVAAMVHNYAQMVGNPAMAPMMRMRGLVKVG